VIVVIVATTEAPLYIPARYVTGTYAKHVLNMKTKARQKRNIFELNIYASERKMIGGKRKKNEKRRRNMNENGMPKNVSDRA
jgi:hypothetical protein